MDLPCAARHRFSLLTCWLALTLLTTARCSLRGAQAVLRLLRPYVPVGVPSPETLRRWLLRVGLHRLQPPPVHPDWIWIVDHLAPVGPTKCLLVVAVRLATLRRQDFVLGQQDVQVIRLDVMPQSTGELMEHHLTQLVEALGPPRQIVSDHGADLEKGVRLLRRTYPAIIDTYDVSHKMACLLKADFEADARWAAFVQQCTRTRFRLQQTPGSFLMPPQLRLKARYMHVHELIAWGQKVLAYLERGDAEPAAADLGMTAAAARPWLAERLGWLRSFRADLTLAAALIAVVQTAQTVVKRQGLSRASPAQFLAALPPNAPSAPRVARLTEQVRAYLTAEAAKLPDDQGYLGTSDLIESLFGTFKGFAAKSTHRGIGPNVLSLPVFITPLTPALIETALETTSFQHVCQWLREKIGVTLLARIRRAFKPFRKDQNQPEKPAPKEAPS